MPIKIRFPYNTNPGVGATASSLNTGEIAINTADRTLHVKHSTGSMKRVMGAQGAAGFQGPAGVQGTQGTVGPQGLAGPQGFSGGQGTTGFQGNQGAQSGVQGSQGPQGAQGFQGIRGAQGFTGVQGVTGSQGFVGAIGFQGFTGSAGNQGFQGQQGNQGDIGRTGFVGPQGPAGAPGPVGPQGARGPTGGTGPTGFPGPTGPTGPMGPTGFPGPPGPGGPWTYGPFGPPGPGGPYGPPGILYYAYVGGVGGDGSTCFPAGSMVLMADMSWKPIELVDVGEKMYSPFGTATCRQRYVTNLGDRKMYRMADNSISWSSEHTFWVKRGEEEYLWTMDKEQLKHEEDIGVIKGIKNWNKIFEGVENQEELFGHIDGFKNNVPVEIKEYRGNKNLPLFLPLTEKGELIIVNGYIVGAAVNEYECDYSKFKWVVKEN